MTNTWKQNGACTRSGATELFFDTHRIEEAKQVCATCPVKQPCLDYAIVNNLDGVWGGLADDERRDYYRKLKNREKKPARKLALEEAITTVTYELLTENHATLSERGDARVPAP